MQTEAACVDFRELACDSSVLAFNSGAATEPPQPAAGIPKHVPSLSDSSFCQQAVSSPGAVCQTNQTGHRASALKPFRSANESSYRVSLDVGSCNNDGDSLHQPHQGVSHEASEGAVRTASSTSQVAGPNSSNEPPGGRPLSGREAFGCPFVDEASGDQTAAEPPQPAVVSPKLVPSLHDSSLGQPEVSSGGSSLACSVGVVDRDGIGAVDSGCIQYVHASFNKGSAASESPQPVADMPKQVPSLHDSSFSQPAVSSFSSG